MQTSVLDEVAFSGLSPAGIGKGRGPRVGQGPGPRNGRPHAHTPTDRPTDRGVEHSGALRVASRLPVEILNGATKFVPNRSLRTLS